jgi:hypothetical protein
MKANFKTILYAVFAYAGILFTLQSCELESEDYSSINASIFPRSAEDVDALVTGNAYEVFRSSYYDFIFSVYDGVGVVSDLTSDNGMCQDGWSRQDLLFVRFSKSSGVYSSYIQENYYFGNYISRMTLTLDRIKNAPIDAALLKKYNAELRLGRGWLAYLLYEAFGPIVIADLETLKNPSAEIILPRLSEEEMQTYIETELTEAAKDLPYNYKKGDASYGRFTKALANTVLLKLYMLTNQWNKAEAIGRELLKPEYNFSLVPEYKDIFTLANEKNAEIIFASQCEPGYAQQLWQPHVLPNDYDFTPYLDGLTKWNGYKLAWHFVNTYDPADKRLETICIEYTSKNGKLHNQATDANDPSAQIYRGAIPLKYEFDPATTGEASQLDWIVYRYADVLTLTAEAIVRNGNTVTDEAVQLLNRVRTRSLPGKAYKLSDFSGTVSFLKAVLDERGWELYFEGCRKADLIRHGVYIEKIKEKALLNGQQTLVDEHYSRYPIPQGVIDEGKGAIIQNPGY